MGGAKERCIWFCVHQSDEPAAGRAPRSVCAGFHRLAVQIAEDERKIASGLGGELSAKAQALVIDAKLFLHLLLHLVQLAIAFLREWKVRDDNLCLGNVTILCHPAARQQLLTGLHPYNGRTRYGA
jgi:hypothetical protein